MQNNTISIIAPAYNHEAYIRQCLWSVATQKYEKMELIVIDDVSTDQTRKIIEELLENSEFCNCFQMGVQFIPHENNMGAFYSLNQGINAANGDYITIINTDDYYGPDRLNALMNACVHNEREYAFGGIRVVDQNNNDITTGYGKELMKYQALIPQCPTVSMALTRGNGTVSTGNMLFSRKLYDALNGFDNYKYVHDWDFALRASLVTEPLFINEAKYYYRLHTGNTISEISNDHRNPDALEKPVDGKTVGVSPLVRFFYHILHSEYTNEMIPSTEVWDYFVNYKKYYHDDDGVVWAWNEAHKINL